MGQDRCLLILRHADSDWNSASNDFDRPLNVSGKENALATGKWLQQSNLIPQSVLCSSALRARQTADCVSQYAFNPAAINHQQGLYLAAVPALLHSISKLEPSVTTALLVAHNPGLEQLVKWYTSREISFKPATLVQLSLPAWDHIEANSAQWVLSQDPPG